MISIGAERNAGTFRILVVDDQRSVADLCGRMLQMLGNEVQVVYSGREAVRTVGSFQPDAVLLDLEMPEMNGYQTAQQIRGSADNEHVVLMALTGRDDEEDRRRTQASGFRYHLTKPLDPRAVMRLLDELHPSDSTAASLS